uniref:Uncharacterized protein AlNc14C40G3466 n=1 Tax=Albugo laibachii Nc14 TaxID=890382 RepID=F0W9L1_9STRA|nr:conserved hypothetical protein [Albugo laibachii Nc14]|eukprot:CCA17829.1 conserved hypothetical protein [Albugo laibachii Nc14]
MSAVRTDETGEDDHGPASFFWNGDFSGLFSNSSVDDLKYERLLDDLRAHDLLGSISTDAILHEINANEKESDNSSLASTSLFLNDPFSAAFTNSFEQFDSKQSSKMTEMPQSSFDMSKMNDVRVPPPGFTSLNSESAPSQSDLNWARGKNQYTETLQNVDTSSTLGDEEKFDAFDESQIIALRGLGLGLDDENGLSEDQKNRPIPASLAQILCEASPESMRIVDGNHRNETIGSVSPLKYTPKKASHHTSNFVHVPSYTATSHMFMQKKYKFMTTRDVNFVVQQQLKQIRMSDPYSDDYYYHNTQKKSRNVCINASPGLPPPLGQSYLLENSSHTSVDPPPALLQKNRASPSIPLPSWQLKHVLTVNTQERQRAKKTRTWENENQVLGRNTKSSLYRPKEMLSCHSDRNHETKTDDAEQNIDTRAKLALSSEVWEKRRQISRGFECLLSLEDARHILDARHIDVQQFHLLDDSQLDPALVHLRSKTTALLFELASILGVTVNNAVRLDGSKECVVQCTVYQLYRILSARNGKHLLSRALPLLHPSARSLLIPHVIEYLFSPEFVDRITASNVLNGDERVCETLVVLFLYHHSTSTAPVLTQALERTLYGHTTHSFKPILLNRPRALLLQKILQRGRSESMQGGMSDSLKKRWSEAENAFVGFATQLNNQGKEK